jgi:hypothetical protein
VTGSAAHNWRGWVWRQPRLFQSSAQARTQLAQANAALQAGEADKALELLHSLPVRRGQAEAYNLRCRVRYTLEQWDEAVERVRAGGQAGRAELDYRSYVAGPRAGRESEPGSFLSAFSLAKRCTVEFEEAVRLNPRNAGALADLGEFYFQAPGVVGGGMDKAEGVAAQLDKVDPARATNCGATWPKTQGLRHGRAGVQAGDCVSVRILPSSG